MPRRMKMPPSPASGGPGNAAPRKARDNERRAAKDRAVALGFTDIDRPGGAFERIAAQTADRGIASLWWIERGVG